MSRWSDLAVWVGPTVNRSADAMAKPPRGIVLHIASGFYAGTIAWQRNASANVSSHFIVARDGRCAQMVDTADGSWAQRAGNSTWLSIELEGFAPDDGLHGTHPGWETLTPAQVEVCARLLARAHQVHGVPLQLAASPSGRGLGHHSMGAESGVDWGHSQCPGVAIKAQKPAILARAIAITNGDDDMAESEWTQTPTTQANPPFAGMTRETALMSTREDAFYTRQLGAQAVGLLQAIAAKVDIDPVELAAIQESARAGTAAALAAAADEWVDRILAGIQPGSDFSARQLAQVEAAVRSAFAHGLAAGDGTPSAG